MNKSILVLDDDLLFLELMKISLEDFTYDIHTFSDSIKAIDFIEKSGVFVDLFIIDIAMPKHNGLEIVKLLRSKEMYYHIPIVFVTGTSDLHIQKLSYHQFIFEYVIKPIDFQLFKHFVKSINTNYSKLKESIFLDKDLKLDGKDCVDLINTKKENDHSGVIKIYNQKDIPMMMEFKDGQINKIQINTKDYPPEKEQSAFTILKTWQECQVQVYDYNFKRFDELLKVKVENKKHIILIEGDENVSKLLNTALSKYSVKTFPNVDIATRVIGDFSEPVDLILIDFNALNLQKFDFIKKVRQYNPFKFIPIICLSHHVTRRMKKVAFDFDILTFIDIPFDEEVLKLRINSIFENLDEMKKSFFIKEVGPIKGVEYPKLVEKYKTSKLSGMIEIINDKNQIVKFSMEDGVVLSMYYRDKPLNDLRKVSNINFIKSWSYCSYNLYF